MLVTLVSRNCTRMEYHIYWMCTPLFWLGIGLRPRVYLLCDNIGARLMIPYQRLNSINRVIFTAVDTNMHVFARTAHPTVSFICEVSLSLPPSFSLTLSLYSLSLPPLYLSSLLCLPILSGHLSPLSIPLSSRGDISNFVSNALYTHHCIRPRYPKFISGTLEH